MKFDVIQFEEIDSTNTYLYNLAKSGAEEGTVVMASYQTLGKGRSGRFFCSPRGNLYMSILIRPNRSVLDLHLITPMCAVCVYDAIKEVLNIDCKIKWVNDLYHNDKKVCGILTEVSLKEDIAEYAVIGIGVNVFPVEFDKDLEQIAGSVIDKKHDSDYENKSYIINSIRDSILKYFDLYYSDYDNKSFMDSYRKNSNIIGKKVYYETASHTEYVDVMDISDDGELIVKDINGETKKYSDGEIRIKI